MLYLLRDSEPERFEIWSNAGYTAECVAQGLTELEVRRFFRDRAIRSAAQAVNMLINDLRRPAGS